MIKIILVFIGAALFCYLCAAGLLYAFQRYFLYFPSEKYEHSFERISVLSQGETIEVVVLNKGKNKAVLYFGGNAEAVVVNAEPFLANFSDTTIYLVNYRGYGGSSGEPTEAAIYIDALAVYDEIKEHHSQISAVGRSLGSGVATYIAAQRDVTALALITPYDSILNVAKGKFMLFPVKLLLKDHYDSLSRAKNISAKVLVLAAEHDEVIPMSHTQRLIDEFKSDQVLSRIIRNANHNNLSNTPEFYQALREFL